MRKKTMRNFSKNLIAASVLSATALGSTAVMAELSGNIGVTSNYLWRGVTQSNDTSAISGGLDWGHDSGFYLGTWASNLSGGDYELDLYGGYGGEYQAFGYDVGVISYQYPVSETYFHEVAFNGTFSLLNFGVAYTFGSDDNDTDYFSSGDKYYYIGAEGEIKKGLSLGGKFGSYDFDDSDAEDYTHFNVYLTKDDFTFAIDQNNLDDTGAGEDKMRVSASWSKSFDL
jgi:uncharacterized protein (TIGR02001 family)